MAPAAKRHRSDIGALEVARRLQQLPEMCALLLAGAHNDEGDVDLVFRGLPFASVVRQALEDPAVAVCLRRFGGPKRWVR